MTINSRAKGASGERELANFLKERGFDARRGQQFSGGSESPDVICNALPFIHLECKRVEKGVLYDWLAQATRDANEKIAVVAHRKSQEKWVAILSMEDFLKLVRMI